MNTITNPKLINKLRLRSLEGVTKLTIEEIREIIGTKEKIGVKTLNLMFPELNFTNLHYKGMAYVRITMKITKDEYTKRLEAFKGMPTIIVGGNN